VAVLDGAPPFVSVASELNPQAHHDVARLDEDRERHGARDVVEGDHPALVGAAGEGPVVADAFRYDVKVLVEQGIDAREVEVAVLDGAPPFV
jgi:hypothetical protein